MEVHKSGIPCFSCQSLLLSIVLKGMGTWNISYCFFVPMLSLGNPKTKPTFLKLLKCTKVVK